MNAFVSRTAIESATLTRTNPIPAPSGQDAGGRTQRRHWFTPRTQRRTLSALGDF